ncbi:DUF692 domain-containing protein [Salinibius halmophilus]|uniref:DUF692 domain-containing protein n=1 Tax=Salinibius halmophilus TaxID=1853216 RepID=UPI000E661C1B|nr:DUF692 domain-containing protein [Salinibius halmophilus]
MKLPRQMGLGLRAPLHAQALANPTAVGFWEAHTENYLRPSYAQDVLLTLAQYRPISLHGVAMSLAGPDPLDDKLLAQTAGLIEKVKPAAISEHFAWSLAGGRTFNDLLPAPLLRSTLNHMVARVDHVQQKLGCQILIENPSTYLEFIEQELSEPELLNELAQRTDCGLLLDLNNLRVNELNHGLSAATYLNNIYWPSVQELHVAGYQTEVIQGQSVAIDSHAASVSPAVWRLFERVIDKHGAMPSLLERDGNIPKLEALLAEVATGKQIIDQHSLEHTDAMAE